MAFIFFNVNLEVHFLSEFGKQQVLRFVARICSMQVEHRGYCSVKGVGNGQSIGFTVSDAIVRSWLGSTVTGISPLGYFSSITASSL